MKKRAATLLLILIVISLLTACGSRDVIRDPAQTGQHEGGSATVSSANETVSPAHAPEEMPLLWQVTDEAGHKLYLFGTIHADDTRSSAVLAGLEPTLSACDALAVEFDAVAFEQDLAAATQAMMQFIYTDGTTIADHLSQEQYEGLKTRMQEAGLYTPYMDMYNPAMWMQTAEQAMLMKYSKLDFGMAMDSLLLQTAHDRGMEVLEVESADFQYGLLNSFSDEFYQLEIRQLLESDGEEYGATLDELYEAWVVGDLEKLTAILTEDQDTEGLTEAEIALVEDYNKKMLDDRNLGMCKKAEAYLQSGKTVFFAVGTAHMLGQNGIVQLLTNAGYAVSLVTLQP